MRRNGRNIRPTGASRSLEHSTGDITPKDAEADRSNERTNNRGKTKTTCTDTNNKTRHRWVGAACENNEGNHRGSNTSRQWETSMHKRNGRQGRTTGNWKDTRGRENQNIRHQKTQNYDNKCVICVNICVKLILFKVQAEHFFYIKCDGQAVRARPLHRTGSHTNLFTIGNNSNPS